MERVPAEPSTPSAAAVCPRTSHSVTALTTTRSGLMTTQISQIDEVAFSVVYGSVSVMAVLMVMRSPIEDPGPPCSFTVWYGFRGGCGQGLCRNLRTDA